MKNCYDKLGLALLMGILLIGGSFVAAHFTQSHTGLFSLEPSVDAGTEVPDLDKISSGKIQAFHATIFTIWATMLLSLPAFCTVWRVRTSKKARNIWLPFWTIGLVAMLIHLYLAMGVLFEWNWDHILNKTVRVTIPIPDLVLTAWWAFDVLIAWLRAPSRNWLIYGQRIAVHALLLIVFLMGFIKEGEHVISKCIGAVVVIAVIIVIIAGRKKWATGSDEIE